MTEIGINWTYLIITGLSLLLLLSIILAAALIIYGLFFKRK